MPYLADLCSDCLFSDAQKDYFWRNILNNVWKEGDPGVLSYEYMRIIWERYDLGGISVGRSIRASLIELGFDYLALSDIKELKKIIAMLIAMYFSPSYINKKIGMIMRFQKKIFL